MSHPKILTKVPGWLQPPGTESLLTLETNIKFYKSLLIAAFRYLLKKKKKRRALSIGLLTYNRDPGTSLGMEDLEAREERQPDTKIQSRDFFTGLPHRGTDLHVFFSALNSVSKPSPKTVFILKNTLALLESLQGFPVPALEPGLWKRKRTGRGTSSLARPENLHEPLYLSEWQMDLWSSCSPRWT